jgi:hypothetical protein
MTSIPYAQGYKIGRLVKREMRKVLSFSHDAKHPINLVVKGGKGKSEI